ncbi:TATA box-binding protein-associated factor RNA polymerase I subunit B-like [Watersipora subatra]|uniref:TATA box-binding protein-associated factor RNA polymerase I subunit B-like n=1 Tax=Watersipora subatra TaxID=2589382 RepID=UPI00355AF056
MVACLVCSGEQFYNAHGLYFCRICDTQTFDFQELGEFDLFNGDLESTGKNIVTGARISQKAQTKKRRNETVVAEYDEADNQAIAHSAPDGKGRPFTTFEVFQTILSAQTNELLKRGFPKALRDRVFKIWCIYLSRLGEAFSSKNNYVIKTPKVRDRDASRLTEANHQFISQSIKEEPSGNHIPLTKGVLEGQSSALAPDKLNMNTILCILYLGISLTDPLYTLSDLIRWVKDGTLPYFHADCLLPEDMKIRYKDHHIFSHLCVPIHSKLRCQTSALARFLQFTDSDFIPVNIEQLCIRYVVGLNLPGEVIGPTVSLLRSKTPYMRLTPFNRNQRKVGVPSYEAVAMSYIIITLRDLFGFYQRLDHHLSSYATAVGQQLGNQSQKPFNVESWMQYMLSAVKLNHLPRHNLDVQRLGDLKSTLDSYSSFAPPPSRHSSASLGKLSVNAADFRKQLESVLDQLSRGVSSCKKQSRQHGIEEEKDEGDVSVLEDSDESPSWSQPDVTSTQQPCGTATTQPRKQVVAFRNHTLEYIINYREFCRRNNLVTNYHRDSVTEHVQQCMPNSSSVEQVVAALMSGGNYRRVSKDDLCKTASQQTLFQICADYCCLSIKELIEVYTTIEEAYICLQNHIPVDGLSSQYVYFPRKEEKPAHDITMTE